MPEEEKIDVRINFKYTHPKYVSFQPLDPKAISKKSRALAKEFSDSIYKNKFYRVKYPEWTKQTVLETSIIDLQEKGIFLNDSYSGEISIKLIEMQSGSRFQVGSLKDRMIQVQQWQYWYEKRTRGRAKEFNIWGTVPTAVFDVTMNLNIAKERYDKLIECSKSVEKLTAKELAELRLERFSEKLETLQEEGIDTISEKAKKDPDFRSMNDLVSLHNHFSEMTEFDLIPSILNTISDKKNNIRNVMLSYLHESIEKNPQKAWSKEILELRQQMYSDLETGRKTRDYGLKRNARKTLRLIEEADEISRDFFHIFRYYMNIHLAIAKYRLNQYWMALIPEWELDYFYSKYDVTIDEHRIHAVPFYSVGALWMHKKGPSDNIHNVEWLQLVKANIKEAASYQTGFTSDGMLTKAYEALLDNECEVAVTLASAAIEQQFSELYLHYKLVIGKEQWSKMGFPQRSNRFRKTLDRWEPQFLKYGPSLGIDIDEVKVLFQRLRYVRDLRNKALHNAIGVETYISRALEDQQNYGKPGDWGVSRLDVSFTATHKKPKPYYWRVLSFLIHSCWRFQSILTRLRNEVLYSSLKQDNN